MNQNDFNHSSFFNEKRKIDASTEMTEILELPGIF